MTTNYETNEMYELYSGNSIYEIFIWKVKIPLRSCVPSSGVATFQKACACRHVMKAPPSWGNPGLWAWLQCECVYVRLGLLRAEYQWLIPWKGLEGN